MYISYKNYQGGIDNLVVVESNGVVTTSIKDTKTAIRTHKRKLKRLKAKQKYPISYSTKRAG
ncbi:hypothetical protein F4694_003761 [Bacillus niacini]|uniref:NERD domain-containing protein n=1 Tax=Neobacillus niacini TaxID=86668 RepID=A0A852TGW8_9BACI|nr:hypothetical protein [Neobacillus niacini]NYE06976.1 hypothetical protein [Neobacillus niacini]